MTKHFRVSLVFSLALVLVLSTGAVIAAQSEAYAPLLGTWDVEIMSMGMQMEFIFKMDGDNLVGEMVFDMGGAELVDIAFEEGKLTFIASIDAGGQMIDLEGEATIEEDKMTGLLFSDMGEVEFSGTKRKDH